MNKIKPGDKLIYYGYFESLKKLNHSGGIK